MSQRIARTLTALLVLASTAARLHGATQASAAVPAERPTGHPTRFAIGGGERDPLTHVSFETPKGLAWASVRVVVDRAAKVGLNFFALEVDFDNGTWAHGGLQDVDGPDGAGTRVRQVNWGGLVDRGGGNADYDEMNPRADLEKIQNPPTGQHVGPYAWKNGVEYELLVERGRRVTLPPGTYSLSPGDQPVRLDHARQMWEWRFTVRPVLGSAEPFVAVLHNAAGTFDTFTVWNEAGYGSAAQAQHTSWSEPLYRTLDGSGARAPASWERF